VREAEHASSMFVCVTGSAVADGGDGDGGGGSASAGEMPLGPPQRLKKTRGVCSGGKYLPGSYFGEECLTDSSATHHASIRSDGES
jgi:hypothetical protein